MGDVVLLDETKDVGASNHRHFAALYCGATSGFEVPIVSNSVYVDLFDMVRYLALGIWRFLIDKILLSFYPPIFVYLPSESDLEDGLIQLAVYKSEIDYSIKFASTCTRNIGQFVVPFCLRNCAIMLVHFPFTFCNNC